MKRHGLPSIKTIPFSAFREPVQWRVSSSVTWLAIDHKLKYGSTVIRGTAAIADFWAGLISAGVKDHGIELLDAQDSGDIAYSNGKWWATGSGEDGTTVRFEGTIVTVLRRQPDGSWKTCLHTWN